MDLFLPLRQFSRLGSSNTPLARWLPAEYQDAVSLPKGWNPEQKVNGQILPLVIYFRISSLLAALQMTDEKKRLL